MSHDASSRTARRTGAGMALAAVALAALAAPPSTTHVAVDGSTVSATITPSGTNFVAAAEYFLGASIGTDGSGAPMTLSGTSGPVTASATLPTLGIGLTYTVWVHGRDYETADIWGPPESLTFSVESTFLPIPLGSEQIVRSGHDYSVRFSPVDPCAPTDPCRVRARAGEWKAWEVLGYTRTTYAAPEGVFSVFTRAAPTDPCKPGTSCRTRSVLVGMQAGGGAKYDASVADLTASFTLR